MTKAYEIVNATSTRKSTDPKSEDYHIWVDFLPGDRVTTWPKHTPVKEWIKAGHWKEAD